MNDSDNRFERSDQTISRRPLDLQNTVLLPQVPRFRSKGAARVKRDTTTLNEQNELILVIRGIVEKVTIPESGRITLGRGSVSDDESTKAINLSQYGAQERGVSRTHCLLHIQQDRLFVTDLGSTNGTFIQGKQIPSGEPFVVRNGDELTLSHLSIQVLYR